MNKLISLIVQLRDEASEGIGKLNSSLGDMAKFAGGTLLAGAFTAVAGAVAGMGATTLSASADFEAATARFASVAGGSLAQAGFALEDVKSKALELGAVTQFSAAQAQDAMINLAKGGVPVKDIMGEATQATLDLAAAGELELAQAADIVAKQLGVWGDTGVQAAQVSNLLAQAANASTVDVDELALGLANVGGVAKVSGVSFQDLTQTMAMIAPGFSSAADAGTSLKTFLLALQPTTENARTNMSSLGLMFFDTAKAAQALGVDISKSKDPMEEVDAAMRAWIETHKGLKQGTEAFDKAYQEMYSGFESSKFYDASGSFVGMDKAAELLQGSLAGLSEAEQSAALKAIFGTDAFRAAALIAKGGSQGFRDMGAAMDAAGSAAEQAAIRNKTFQFAWDSLKGSIETFQIMVGGALLPLLTDLTNNALIPAVNAVSEFAGAILSSTDPWSTFIGMLNQVIPGLGSFVELISGQILPILAGIGAMILAAVVPAFWAWAAAAIPAAIATIAATAPLLLIIGAIGLAVGLLVAAWQNNWFGIQEATAAVWAFLQPILAELWTWLGVQLVAAGQALAAFWSGTLWPALQAVGGFIVGTVVPAFMQIWQWLSTNIPAAISTVVGAFNSIVATVTGIVAGIVAGWNQLVTTTTTTWNQVVTTVQSVASTIGGVVSTALYVVVTIAQAVWNTLVYLTSAAWQQVLTAIQPALDWISTTIGPVITGVVAAASAAWSTLSSAASGAWAAVVSVVSSAVASLVSAAAGAWASITSAASTAWAGIQSTVSTAINAVSSVVSSVIATIVGVVTGGWGQVQTATSGPWEQVKFIIQGVMTAIKVAIDTGIAVVKTIMSGAWQVIVAAARNDFGSIPAILSAVWERVKAILNAGVGAIKSIAGALASAAASLGQNIVNGVISGLSAAGSKIADKLKSLASSALNAAKSALGIKSPSTVFAMQVGIPIIDGIVAGLQNASPKAVGAVLDLGSKLVDVVSKGVDAFGKLRNLGTIPNSAIAAFSNSLNVALQQFATMASTWDKAAISWASQFQAKAAQVVETLTKGVEFLIKLADLGPVAPDAADRLASGIAAAMRAIVAISNRETLIALAGAQAFAKVAGEILSIVKTGVDAIAALGNLTDPPAGSIARFAQFTGWLVTRFAQVGGSFEGPILGAAQAFAESAGKVLGIVGSGVEGLNKLSTLAEPVQGSFLRFAQYIGYLVLRLAQVAGQIDRSMVGAAVTFAEGVGKVLAIISAGVEGLNKLSTFAGVPDSVFEPFVYAISAVVVQMWLASSLISRDAVSAAAAFAEGAGKILAIIKPGVEGLSALAGFASPAWDSMAAFRASLMQWVGAMVQLAEWFDGVSLDAAVAFSESAAKILSIIKSGVEGLSALAGFTAPTWDSMAAFRASLMQWVGAMVQLAEWFAGVSLDAAVAFADGAGKTIGVLKSGVEGLNALADLGPVSQVAIDAFAEAIGITMTRLAAVAVTFSEEAIAQAGKFADAAGKTVGILKTGVEGLLMVNTFTGVSAEAIDRFGAGVQLAVAKMVQLATQFGAEGVAAAEVFAKAAGESTDFLKKGVDGFIKLGDLKEIPEQGMNLFATGIVALINTIIRLSTILSTDVVLRANQFSNTIDSVIQIVKSGLDAIAKLGTDAKNVEAFTNALVNQVNIIAQALATQAKPASQNIGVNIAYGLAAGITAGVPAIQNAVYAAINAALAAARAALGIASPSKVMAGLGQLGGAGLAQGFATATPMVAAAAGAMAGASIAPVRQTVAVAPRPVGGGGGGTSTTSTPVTFASGSIVIQQLPGENADQLADRVIAKVEGRIASRRR